ncbi:MAG: DMT family transporter [Deltaproteobacteria bacterium]|nr:DMT family transporter [Deltaproteobacteria bacterium]
MHGLLFGISMSLISSLFWATAVINFRKARDTKSSLVVNLGKNVIGIIAFGIALLVTGTSLTPEAGIETQLRLLASGVFGVALGDLLFMASLYLLGAGLNSIVGCFYTPMLITGSILFLGESVSPGLWAGGTLVMAAIYLASVDNLKQRPRSLKLGIIIGFLSMAATVSGVVFMKPVLTTHSLLWVNFIRLLTGMLFLIIYLMIKPGRAKDIEGMKIKDGWINLIIGGLSGSFLAVFFWTVSLKSLPASLVAVLGQLTVIVILIFARFWLNESLTPRKILASFIAVTGAILASVF